MCQKYDFLISAIDLLKPEYFEDKVLVWYFQTIRDFFLDYHKSPSKVVVKEELRKSAASGRIKDTEFRQYVEVFPKLWADVDSADYLIEQVVQFCRRQALRRAFLEYAPKIDRADDQLWGEIQSEITDACGVGAHTMDLGTQYFKDYHERLHNRVIGEEKLIVPSGIRKLDEYIGGGLKAGQVGVWLGGTGVGKSIVLPHCGRRGVVEGLKVAHYTLELDDKDIAERYDAGWSSVALGDLAAQTKIVERRLASLGRQYGNSLIIKFYPTRTATLNTIRSHVRQLHSLGFKPDLLVVDYLDLLKPLTSYNDEYADLGAITADLRGLAGELSLPIWTATQVNRGGLNVEVVDLEHIGDSLKKAQIADIVVAICMTKEERQKNEARLYLAKNRNGPTGVTVKIETAYHRMCFCKQVPAPQPITGKTRRVGRRSTATAPSSGGNGVSI